ncbi:MAG: AtpZ/AtpI family protein [Thermodesulfobacteriota bacterium]
MPKKNQKWMYFIVVGTNFGFSVAAGLLLGRYLDNKFGNETPYFTILGLLAGVFSGMALLIRMLKLKNDNK